MFHAHLGVGVRTDQVIVFSEGTLSHLLLQVVDVLLHLLVDSLPLTNLELSILHILFP